MQSLLVAPRTDLEYADSEIQNVANSLHPRLVMGDVTLARVVQELQSGQYDIVWFSSHGDADGILLSDGALTPSMLTQLLRSCPPRLLFLNTCSSFNIAMAIHDSIGAPVMATICDVPDRDAFVTGSVAAATAARQIATGRGALDVGAIYQESKPGQNRTYVLLNGSVRLGGEDKQDDLMQMMVYMMRRHDELAKEISDGSTALREEMSLRYQPRLSTAQTRAWFAAYVIFVFAALLFRDEVAAFVGLPWHVAFVIVALIDTISAILFMWGIGLPMPPWKKGPER